MLKGLIYHQISAICNLYSVNPVLRSWLCSRSAIQTSLTIVFLLVAQHNSSKLDSVFAPASVDCSRLLAKFTACKKPLHLRVGRCRGENPRIVNARSSLGISHEHEWIGAWQYVSISLAMWQRKRYGYLYVLSCLQGANKCAEYQWISVVEQAGMRRSTLFASSSS